MKRLALGLSVLVLLAGCGSDGGGGSEMTVSLGEQNGSTQSGEATLTAVGDSTTHVVISIRSGGETRQPVHIHKGSCSQLDPQPEHPLEDLVEGKSSTHLNVSLAELRDGEFAINVHKSAEEMQTYVSCGDIGSSDAGTQTETDSGGYEDRY